ncbi:DUF3367 domain-containing protein [Calidifontibacter sp. DB0510]|uniref:DUF3367 domain-containing protein n=1 Tax=Metallococcus carri TaxID=1656884 RepID=A0A967B3G1_9MICO|nr:alpha-(1->3)-arabinofuranosyltransferase family protein [Metallococcus carri]NHN54957.1 DUF3367 domain-containing protein [Metallococcus carri]NOP37303.1 DUF3367 domain-containing protein [Calidifontibacter sp. DB2511S]
MRRLFTPYRTAVGAAVALLALVVGLNAFGSFYTDIKPEVYLAPVQMIGRYLSAWNESPYLGSPNFNVGLVPVLFATGFLRSIGFSPEWTFKVFHFALWLLAGWGAARLTRRLDVRGGRWAGLIAGIVYVANPYDMQAGSTLAILLPYALLPWLLICLVRAFRRPSGWAWPAAFGLVFFAMSGMNVAVVPTYQLLAIIPLAIAAHAVWRVRWSAIVLVVAKCALFVVGVSIYWLVPGGAAINTGSQIVAGSETLDGIAKVSSFPEVLRGMGMWPLYGTYGDRAWVPQDAVFVTSTVVMVLTILWAVIGLLAMTRAPRAARYLAAGCVGLAAVVMVGAFPDPARPASLFGRAFVQLMQLPFASAFRTTNKIGAVLALGFSVAIGCAAVRWWPRLRGRALLPELAAACAVILVASWVLPALTNRLYLSQLNIPQYWQQAAEAADRGSANSTVLFLPGQVRPAYRWTEQRPDDLPNSLIDRVAVLPETTPNASAPGSNYLAALDDSFQNGGMPANTTMSAYAYYLGADQVMLRNDTAWEDTAGIRPSLASTQISNDPGMFGVANFGPPGDYVYAPGDPANRSEAFLSPVQLFALKDAVASVRAEPAANSLVVAGDAWSVAQLNAAGLLTTRPTFQYAGGITRGDLLSQLGAGHRLVITDTNARRAAVPNRLTNGYGPVLSADQPLVGGRTLGTDPADQTVMVPSGATVSATAEGGAFFDLPYAAPANAIDGDPATAWLFGDFDRAVGQRLTINQPAPVRLGTIKISQADVGVHKIGTLTVTAGGRSITQRVPDKGYASFDFGATLASRVTVTVATTRGPGFNLVGINDIKMAGPPAVRTLRTPVTFDRLYRGLSPAERARFSATPLDVLLTRLKGTNFTTDDTETGLRRLVTLPDARRFDVSAQVRVNAPLEQAYDRLAGLPPGAAATSSGFYFDDGSYRAAAAADGSQSTAWIPGGKVDQSWWQLSTAARSISQVVVDQRRGLSDKTGEDTQWAGSAVVTVDGKQVGQAKLTRDGRTTISFPAVRGKTVRLTFTAAGGPRVGAQPRFTAIDTGYTLRPVAAGPLDQPDASGNRCIPVGQVDGQPVRMRPVDPILATPDVALGSRWEACAPLSLAAGQHRIEQAPGFTIDNLSMLDASARQQAVPVTPVQRITANHASAKGLKVTAPAAFNVILGQSYDPRWKATANGKSLGKPVLLDGYSVGWRIPRGGSYDIRISYGPQTSSNIALAVSVVVLLIALALVLLARRNGTLADPEPEPRRRLRPAFGRLPRPAIEVGLVALAFVGAGWAGLAAGLGLVALLRWRPQVRSDWLTWAGAALILSSMVVYLIVLGPLRGTISADGVAKSLWPHYLAAAGLVLALTGVVRGASEEEGPR